MSNTDYASPSGNLEKFARAEGLFLEEAAPYEEKPLFDFVSMSDLMSRDYRIVYLCNGVLAKGQPAIIGGPQKSFKTSLALELAVCLATGLDFLGHFGVPEPVKVCYFSGEGGLGVIQDTLRRIGQAKDVNISQIDNLTVTDRVPRLDNMVHLEAVREYIEQHGTKSLPHIIPNPVDGEEHELASGKLSRRCDAAIKAFRFATVEFDGMSRADQLRFWSGILRHGLLEVTCLIDSGGKTIHAWLKVDMPNQESWDSTIKHQLFEKWLIPLGVDSSTRNPARLSRLPGHKRTETGKLQRILWLNDQ